MNRAYSVLDVKSIDRERRVFRGIATTPTPDRAGDVIDPKGMTFKNPLPLLWQHKHDAPIGQVRFEAPTAKGTPFEAEIPVVKEAGPLKDPRNVDRLHADSDARAEQVGRPDLPGLRGL
jgi:hypothetical protein